MFRRRPPESLDPKTREWLQQLVEEASPWPGVIAGTKTPRYDTLRCQHCQGVHFRGCPKVKELELYESGAVKRVAFWGPGEWNEDAVIWPEDVWDDPEVVGAEE